MDLTFPIHRNMGAVCKSSRPVSRMRSYPGSSPGRHKAPHICDSVVECNVANVATRVRFPTDVFFFLVFDIGVQTDINAYYSTLKDRTLEGGSLSATVGDVEKAFRQLS